MDQLVYDLRHNFVESMDDDFNVAPALAALFQFTREINRIMDQKGLSSDDKEKVKTVLDGINSILGVMDLEPVKPDKTVEELIKRRDEARIAKDWVNADRIRQELKEMGIEIIDTKGGTIWRKG
jgi:cysteinyl-tRNA synthetase